MAWFLSLFDDAVLVLIVYSIYVYAKSRSIGIMVASQVLFVTSSCGRP